MARVCVCVSLERKEHQKGDILPALSLDFLFFWASFAQPEARIAKGSPLFDHYSSSEISIGLPLAEDCLRLSDRAQILLQSSFQVEATLRLGDCLLAEQEKRREEEEKVALSFFSLISLSLSLSLSLNASETDTSFGPSVCRRGLQFGHYLALFAFWSA